MAASASAGCVAGSRNGIANVRRVVRTTSGNCDSAARATMPGPIQARIVAANATAKRLAGGHGAKRCERWARRISA